MFLEDTMDRSPGTGEVELVLDTSGSPCGIFLFEPNDSLFKILYLIVMDASEKWTMPLQNWGMILNQLQVYFGERLEVYL
jgi:hypothetical protein